MLTLITLNYRKLKRVVKDSKGIFSDAILQVLLSINDQVVKGVIQVDGRSPNVKKVNESK